MKPAERVVVVEGTDDRNFVKGLLLSLGCTDARPGAYPLPLQDGDWGLRGVDGSWLRLVNAGGKDNLVPRAQILVKPDGGVATLVVVGDPDEVGPFPAVEAAWRGRVSRRLAEGLGDRRPSTFLVAWGDPSGQGPHDLEAQVGHALRACHPERDAGVSRWLADPPTGRADGKARVWSWYAKWTEAGSPARFYQGLWSDPLVADALRAGLQATGTWPAFEALAGVPPPPR